MKALNYAIVGLLALLLSGCLEVKQHPGWVDGAYAGKPDNRSDQVKFHNDKMAWYAAISDRNQYQNEYNRAPP